MMKDFIAELRQFMPSDRIYTDELRTLGWGTDASFYRQIPKVVLRSDGEEEISRIVCLCRKYRFIHKRLFVIIKKCVNFSKYFFALDVVSNSLSRKPRANNINTFFHFPKPFYILSQNM